MKKATLTFLVFFFFFGSNPELIDAQGLGKNLDEVVDSLQKYRDVLAKAEFSRTGLEVWDFKKIRLSINLEGSGFEKIRLTQERIRTKCELRLRQAGLDPVSQSNPFDDALVIHALVTDRIFTMQMGFSRTVLFNVEGKIYAIPAFTWDRIWGGTHGKSPDYIIQSLDEYFDSFLNEYLKANVK